MPVNLFPAPFHYAAFEVARQKAIAAGVKFEKPSLEFVTTLDSLGNTLVRTNKDTGDPVVVGYLALPAALYAGLGGIMWFTGFLKRNGEKPSTAKPAPQGESKEARHDS